MNWKEDLADIQQSFMFEPMDAQTLSEIEVLFRAKHPGPWKMRWNRAAANCSYRQLQHRGEFIVVVTFDNEQDQMWWLLQNGD